MKILKWFNWTVVIPVTAFVMVLLLMIYTNPGLRFNVWLAEKFVPQLHIEQAEGSLFGGMELSNIRYQTDALDAAVETFRLKIDNHCFWSVKICLNDLTVDGLQLTMHSSAEPDTADAQPESEPSSAPSSLLIPLPLVAEQIALHNISINIDGTELKWQYFQTSLNGWGSKLQLDHTVWRDLSVSLAATDSEPSTEPFRYIAPALPDIRFPLSVYINQFSLFNATLEQPQPQHIDELSFSLQLQDTQARLTNLLIKHELATLHAGLNLHTTGNYPLQGNLSLDIHHNELQGQHLALELNGDLQQLFLYAKASRLLEAEINADISILSNDLPLRLALNSQHLAWPVTDKPDVEINNTRLRANGDLNGLNIALQTQYKGKAIPQGDVDIAGNVSTTAADLHTLNINTLGGSLSATANAQWQDLASWQTTLNLKNIQPGLFWKEYDGKISGRFIHHGQLTASGGWQVAVDEMALTGSIRNYPLRVEGKASAADQDGNGHITLNSSAIRIQHHTNQLTLNGSLQDNWQLAVALSVPDLQQTVAGATGNIQGNITVKGQRDTPQLNADFSANDIKWQDIGLQTLSLNAAVTVAEAITANIRLQADNGRFAEQQLHKLTLQFDGTETKHQLTLNADAAEFAAELALNGQFDRQSQNWQGSLNQAVLESLQGKWQLASAAEIQYKAASQSVSLKQHCWQQQQSQLCIEDSQASAENGQVALSLTQFDLATLTPFLPDATRLQGHFDLHTQASWKNNQLPQLELKINGTPGQVQQQLDLPVVLPWQSFSIIASVVKETLNSELHFHFTDEAQLHAKAQITQLQSDDKQLQASLDISQFTLHFLKPLLDEYSELEGVISSNLLLNGSLLSPRVNGELALNNLKIKGNLAPVDINQADIALSFHGKDATLSGAVQTPDGDLNINGQAGWPDPANWYADLKVAGDELRLQIPQAHFAVKPDIQIQASPQRTRVSGSIDIPSAEISVDSLPQSAVAVSDDVILLDEELEPVTEKVAGGFPLEVDVKVILRERVRLSAFGLKTRLRGELRVQQQNNQPRVNGEVVLLDGTFRSYGQDLIIRQGKMTFSGPADQPYLTVEAIRNPANMEDDIIAGIRVTGPADEPSVTIFSEPSKPQANALSYLLMGRDLDSESGSAANAVTTSLIGMSIASSSKVVGEIGEAFGVRDLTLDTAGAGDNSQVTVSGYLSRNLQVKYGVGIFNSIGEFTLRYRLMRSLYLEAVSGLDNTVDLLYKFEFD